jgi:arylsulfatase A-like enzyme
LNREALFFHYPHYHHINTMGPSGAVRMGDYKLVERYETGSTELYNLREDVGERRDLAGEKPALTARMTRMLHDWREASGSAMPVLNPGWKRQPKADAPP